MVPGAGYVLPPGAGYAPGVPGAVLLPPGGPKPLNSRLLPGCAGVGVGSRRTTSARTPAHASHFFHMTKPLGRAESVNRDSSVERPLMSRGIYVNLMLLSESGDFGVCAVAGRVALTFLAAAPDCPNAAVGRQPRSRPCPASPYTPARRRWCTAASIRTGDGRSCSRPSRAEADRSEAKPRPL